MLSSISLLKLREDIRNLMLIIFMLPKGCQTKLLSDNQSGPINCDSKVYVYLITENNRYVFQIIQGTGTRANSEIFQKGLRRKFWKNVMSYSLKTEQMNIPHSLFLFFFFFWFFLLLYFCYSFHFWDSLFETLLRLSNMEKVFKNSKIPKLHTCNSWVFILLTFESIRSSITL